MGGSYQVTLTKPFYAGLFEVTQKQWTLVMGSNPSNYSGDKRPVETVSWNAIRGNSLTYDWPGSSAVDTNSFVGRIQIRTGLAFDLPTEAQWEYACRAGTTSSYNNGGSTTNDLSKLGRYWDNGGSSSHHAVVGSYQPNAWGLYDMHGNVYEWCLDWYYGSLSGGTDPKGSSSGSRRVTRGGCWYDSASNCSSSYRYSFNPSGGSYYYGFRLVRTLSN
jgi:formylglycine-generating enzyme required for sulfatase activity